MTFDSASASAHTARGDHAAGAAPADAHAPREGAPTWFVARAREALLRAELVESDGGAAGFHVAHVPAGVQVGRVQGRHMWRPPTRSGAAAREWDEAFSAYRAVLEADGFTVVRVNSACVLVAPPPYTGPVPVLRLERVGIGEYRVSCDDHPVVAGRVSLPLNVRGSTPFQVFAPSGRAVGAAATLEQAACDLADFFGLGPVQVVHSLPLDQATADAVLTARRRGFAWGGA